MLAEIVATEFKFSETSYAQKEDIGIACQAVGDGPVYIVVVPAIVSTFKPLALNRRR